MRGRRCPIRVEMGASGSTWRSRWRLSGVVGGRCRVHGGAATVAEAGCPRVRDCGPVPLSFAGAPGRPCETGWGQVTWAVITAVALVTGVVAASPSAESAVAGPGRRVRAVRRWPGRAARGVGPVGVVDGSCSLLWVGRSVWVDGPWLVAVGSGADVGVDLGGDAGQWGGDAVAFEDSGDVGGAG